MLADELGLEPSKELEQLESAILRQDAALDPRAGHLSVLANPARVADLSLRLETVKR